MKNFKRNEIWRKCCPGDSCRILNPCNFFLAVQNWKLFIMCFSYIWWWPKLISLMVWIAPPLNYPKHLSIFPHCLFLLTPNFVSFHAASYTWNSLPVNVCKALLLQKTVLKSTCLGTYFFCSHHNILCVLLVYMLHSKKKIIAFKLYRTEKMIA